MVNSRVRTTAALAALGMVPALFALSGQAAAAGAATSGSMQTRVATTPVTPAHGVYHATVTRTEHGIAHIVANNFGSLGFGSGYAAIQTSGCTLADVLL